MAAGPASLSPSEADPPDTPPGPSEAPDEALLAAVLAGDEAALGRLNDGNGRRRTAPIEGRFAPG